MQQSEEGRTNWCGAIVAAALIGLAAHPAAAETGYAMRGDHSEIVFDLNDPMGDSTCVACGECVQACPTGALMPKGLIGSQTVDRKVDSVCPFCGVGCQITYNVKDEKIVSV